MKSLKSINFKSVLTKAIMAAGVAFASLVALNTTNNTEVHAAVTANDPQYVTVNYSPNYGVTVWDSYKAGRHITGQYLQNATTWKVYDVAYDEYGNKWYNIGENENKWVLAIFVKNANNANNTAASTANTTTQTSGSNYNASATRSNYSYSAPKTNYAQSNTTSYSSNVSGSEASAKAWIAGRESGGSYSARNGQYVGKYQLSASYLNGDYSAANQERVADNYVKSRYGSWTAAQSFWQANGWY